MTRKIITLILLVAMMFLLCGCDISLDSPLARKTSNTKAYIKMGEKTIVIDINAYTDYSNGIVIVYGTDGKTYKTHFMNVVLIKEVEGR